MYGCKSWTIKKAECWRIDAFKLWCWRRLLRVPWTVRRSNQSILKESSPEYALEGLMLKLKLQYFGHLMRRADSFEKTLMLGKIEGGKKGDDRGWDGWMAWPTQWAWVWVNSGVGDGQGGLACCSPWGRRESDTTEQLNWTESRYTQNTLTHYPHIFTCTHHSDILSLSPIHHPEKTSYILLRYTHSHMPHPKWVHYSFSHILFRCTHSLTHNTNTLSHTHTI